MMPELKGQIQKGVAFANAWGGGGDERTNTIGIGHRDEGVDGVDAREKSGNRPRYSR